MRSKRLKAYSQRRSQINSVELFEGERIEDKVQRIMLNKEPITDGAPEIFTERKDGVVAGYNIRSDRWEIATDAMDKVQKSIVAKRDAKGKKGNETKLEVVKDNEVKKTESQPTASKDANNKASQ